MFSNRKENDPNPNPNPNPQHRYSIKEIWIPVPAVPSVTSSFA